MLTSWKWFQMNNYLVICVEKQQQCISLHTFVILIICKSNAELDWQVWLVVRSILKKLGKKKLVTVQSSWWTGATKQAASKKIRNKLHIYSANIVNFFQTLAVKCVHFGAYCNLVHFWVGWVCGVCVFNLSLNLTCLPACWCHHIKSCW